jgi:hypothetical protein
LKSLPDASVLRGDCWSDCADIHSTRRHWDRRENALIRWIPGMANSEDAVSRGVCAGDTGFAREWFCALIRSRLRNSQI